MRAPFTLAFAELETERDFVDSDNRAAVPRARFCALLALALSLPFITVDVASGPGLRPTLLSLHLLGLLALATAAVVMSVWRHAYRHIQLLIASAMVIYSWCASASATVAPVTPDYAILTALLLLLALAGVARVRFTPAVRTAALMLPPAYLVAVTNYEGPWHQLAFDTMAFAAFAILDLTVALVLEQSKRRMFLINQDLVAERQRSDRLLHNILPEEIAARLKASPTSIADSVDEATVLFADIVGFTPLSSSLPPSEIVRLLDALFGLFDDVCELRGIEKIKTVGDAYMAVAGIPRPDPDHAATVVELALDMQRAVAHVAPMWPTELSLRIGISSGPVVAGVIGHRKFAYDLWGDTVNTASRMESHGRPNGIHVSESTYELLKDRYAFGDRRRTEIKGMGTLTTYYLVLPDMHSATLRKT